MDTKEALRALVQLPGASGREEAVAERVRALFTDAGGVEVETDKTYSTYARMHDMGGGPKVILCAHADEIALVVSDIDDRGFLSFEPVGGIDRRILPCQEVWVWGRERLFGVIGAKPPHMSP